MENPPIVEVLDITDSNSSDEMTFPSDEYGKFMNLLVKWNLSDSCSNDILQFSKSIAREDIILPTSVKQGRKYLDQLAEPYISFKKVAIM